MWRLPLCLRRCLGSLLLVDYAKVVFVTAVGALAAVVCIILIIGVSSARR